jgi:hypothetical protein
MGARAKASRATETDLAMAFPSANLKQNLSQEANFITSPPMSHDRQK